MVNSYQQRCAGRVSWNHECLAALRSEGLAQVLRDFLEGLRVPFGPLPRRGERGENAA